MNPAYKIKQRFEVRDWSREFLSLSNGVVFDTETTGFGHGAEIVQIAILNTAGETLFKSLVKPQLPIGLEVSDLIRLTNDDLKDAPTWQDIYPNVARHLTASNVIAYNAEFDARMIAQSSARYGLPPIEWSQIDCAMKLYARFAGEWNFKRKDWKWHKLSWACQRENLPAREFHNAETDARATWELIVAMANWQGDK